VATPGTSPATEAVNRGLLEATAPDTEPAQGDGVEETADRHEDYQIAAPSVERFPRLRPPPLLPSSVPPKPRRLVSGVVMGCCCWCAVVLAEEQGVGLLEGKEVLRRCDLSMLIDDDVGMTEQGFLLEGLLDLSFAGLRRDSEQSASATTTVSSTVGKQHGPGRGLQLSATRAGTREPILDYVLSSSHGLGEDDTDGCEQALATSEACCTGEVVERLSTLTMEQQ